MKSRNQIGQTRVDRVFDVCNVIFMALIILIMAYPLYFTIIASISDPNEVALGNILFVPHGFTLEAYENVFRNDSIWLGYFNSLRNTVFGTLLALFLTIPPAYALSKQELPGRTAINWIFLFTMYFGGGMIPYYLVVRSLNLLDKPYTVIILCGGCGVMNMIITRTYYKTSISQSIYEAAYIDGSSELNTFVKIALPLSKPIIAVIALYCAVGLWNEYMTTLIYTSSRDYQTLQLVLRQILILNQKLISQIDFASDDGSAVETAQRMAYMAQAMKYSVIIIASLPMLIAYPFVQKYFVKGMMIGSLKG